MRALLQKVQKPGRYVGAEFGLAGRDPETASVRILLSYPDIYELGMSNEGVKILYDRINRMEEGFADRLFLPEGDLADELLSSEVELFSLERRLTARSFDLWGFNVAHELHYTNLLYALELAAIPLLRSDRRDQDPIIMAGGTAVANPLPLFDFMDAIFIGDGEEAIEELVGLIGDGKKRGASRKEIIASMGAVEGVVLPENFSEQSPADSSLVTYQGEPVSQRRYLTRNFSGYKYLPLPSIAISQDRLVLELARGCGQPCRFCQVGFWKRPVRNVQVENIISEAERLLSITGYDSISLHALSLADYPWLDEVVQGLAEKFGPRGVSLSLPSLRVQRRTIPLLQLTQGVRRSSITFALEAGGEMMREVIRKRASEKKLLELVGEVYELGWDLVKVYFMLGLPDSTGNEVEELIASLQKLDEVARAHGPRKKINVSVSLFVPKPFTTFQWEAQRDPEYFFQALSEIKKSVKGSRIQIKYPNPWMAYIEGLFSRADARSGELLLKAYRRGARFDSWDDHFQRSLWEELLGEVPDDLRRLWLEGWPAPQATPWMNVVDGFPLERLQRDYEKFKTQSEVQDFEPKPEKEERPAKLELKPIELDESKFEIKQILELNYSKLSPFIYIGHLDTAEVLRKALRRAKLPMSFSRGFNKHEKLHFIEPLPLYFYSESETLYIELYENVDLNLVKEKIRVNLPEGLKLRELKLHEKLPSRSRMGFYYNINSENESELERIFELLNSAPENISVEKSVKTRRGKKKVLKEKELRTALFGLKVYPGTVAFGLRSPDSGAISITALLKDYLKLPVEQWNVEFNIFRLDAPDL